jgi:hypothetical protein
MEGLVPQQLYSTATAPAESVSAVKALALADAQGQKIWTITKTNLSTALASVQLPASVETDISNAVNAGKVVTTQTTPVAYAGGNFTGYLVIDPSTGAGGYLLGNGTNGSHTVDQPYAVLGLFGLSFEVVVTAEQTFAALIKYVADEVLDALGKASTVVGLILTIADALYKCQGASSTDLLEVVALGLALFAVVAVLALIPGLIGILISLVASFYANKAVASFMGTVSGCKP